VANLDSLKILNKSEKVLSITGRAQSQPANNDHESGSPLFSHTARRPTRCRRSRVLPPAGPSLLHVTLYRTPPPPFNWCAPSISSPSFSSASARGAVEHFSPTPPSSSHKSHQNRALSPPKHLRRRLVHVVVLELTGRDRIATTTTQHCFDLESPSLSPPSFGAAGPSSSHGRPPKHRRCLRASPHHPPSCRAVTPHVSKPHDYINHMFMRP
jgi:hypothetical protein